MPSGRELDSDESHHAHSDSEEHEHKKKHKRRDDSDSDSDSEDKKSKKKKSSKPKLSPEESRRQHVERDLFLQWLYDSENLYWRHKVTKDYIHDNDFDYQSHTKWDEYVLFNDMVKKTLRLWRMWNVIMLFKNSIKAVWVSVITSFLVNSFKEETVLDAANVGRILLLLAQSANQNFFLYNNRVFQSIPKLVLNALASAIWPLIIVIVVIADNTINGDDAGLPFLYIVILAFGFGASLIVETFITLMALSFRFYFDRIRKRPSSVVFDFSETSSATSIRNSVYSLFFNKTTKKLIETDEKVVGDNKVVGA